jgi:lipopolysaccharide biosynthesis glycosyltransferase
MLKVFIGYDPREAVVYHACCQSIIKHAKQPIAIIPLALNALHEYNEVHDDASNAFIYSRFLVPYLCNFEGRAIFIDGDMICKEDIAGLFEHYKVGCAVHVAKHDYTTKHPVKYLGNSNDDYPRKNWSSVMVWNCGHPANKVLTPEFVEKQTGNYLHRFKWLDDGIVGELPLEWNWLVDEYEHNDNAKLLHYTIGAPCFGEYANCDHSSDWYEHCVGMLQGMEK